jgi:hypothetical protein
VSDPRPKAIGKRAVVLTAFRALPVDRSRQPSAATFPAHPYQGCERMIRMARAVGLVTDSPAGAYAAQSLARPVDDATGRPS